jgi:hypothetical protein
MVAKPRSGPGSGEAPFIHPTPVQRRWLRGGLGQPGGKLPLFDANGQRVSERTVRSCIAHGWAEPWFSNPLKPDWLVCKLTHLGRVVAEEGDD